MTTSSTPVQPAASPSAHAPLTPGRLAWQVFFVSAGVLAFEIVLLRVLLVASWHHFAFLVISLALLGFGASGTVLFIARSWLLQRTPSVLFILTAATALLMPVCVGLAQHLPIESRLLPALLWRQIGSWLLYWVLLSIPFFLGASAICMALMAARQRVAAVYALNLLGSAAGAAAATLLMHFIPPAWLPLTAALLTLLALPAVPAAAALRAAVIVAAVALIAYFSLAAPPTIRMDRVKYGAYARQLAQQDQAQRVAAAFSPRAMLEAYRSPLFHDLAFLTGPGIPPPVAVLLADGHYAGSVMEIDHPADAAILDATLTAFPYALAPAGPDVLLLGETGGVNVWLARRHHAADVTAVHPDPDLFDLVTHQLAGHGGAVFTGPDVRVAPAALRHFVAQRAEKFDLIQLVALESSAAGTHGLGGLAEDHLATVEGFTDCIDRLTDRGLLTVTRAIQTPPRDNLKLFTTLAAALQRNGVTDPGRHFVIVRDFLAVCTVVRPTPWTATDVQDVRREIAARGLTPVWFPGIRPDELNHPDVLDGPVDAPGDWYHHAAAEIFNGRSEQLQRQWPFAISPPTDDRPFFFDFCKLETLGRLREAFGDLWLTRTELAFPLVLASVLVIGLVAALWTVTPLLLFSKTLKGAPLLGAAFYFTAIGLAYLFLEMAALSRLTLWIGDPVSAAAVTVSTFLALSGAGSLTAQRFGPTVERRFKPLLILLIIVAAAAMFTLSRLGPHVGHLTYALRAAAALGVIAPAAFLMGFPMPAALRRLDATHPNLVPWAWGINGFASVLAAPAATALAMSAGYTAVALTALALYLVPALTFTNLTRR